MKKKLRKRISAGLIISVLAVMAALLAVFAIRPHSAFRRRGISRAEHPKDNGRKDFTRA
ncbi:MAG: hypothetical protein V8Q06_05060 [Acutalibacteraceae bacterium]